MVCIGTAYTALWRTHVAACSLNKTYFKKYKTTVHETTNKMPVGRRSGPLMDMFGSTEPGTHALLERCWRKKLSLNIIGAQIEIYAPNSAFLRCLACASFDTSPKQSRDPGNPRTIELHGQSHLGWYYQHTRNEGNLSGQSRTAARTYDKRQVRLWLHWSPNQSLVLENSSSRSDKNVKDVSFLL